MPTSGHVFKRIKFAIAIFVAHPVTISVKVLSSEDLSKSNSPKHLLLTCTK